MTKSVILFLLFFFCAQITIAQLNTSTDLEVQELKGMISHVFSEIYDVVDTGRGAKQVWVYSKKEYFNREGNYTATKTKNATRDFDDSNHYVYDALKNLVLEKKYDENGVAEQSVETTYASNGNTLTVTTRKYEVDDKGVLIDSMIDIETYIYNDENKMEEKWSSELKEDGTYSPSRLYTRYGYATTDNKDSIRTQLEYRDSGNPTIATVIAEIKNREGKVIESRGTQTHFRNFYDEQGRCRRINNLQLQSDELISYIIFSYDKWGNRTGTATYDPTGKIIGDVFRSEYPKTDLENNWTVVKGFKNGKLIRYCKRKIVYYR